jgi:hypothetical protein
MRNRTLVATIAVLVATVAFVAQGQQEPQKMTAEQQAMMDEWMKVATPGQPHKLLERLAGSYTVEVTQWEKPGAPPSKSAGTCESRMVLGGRFVHDSFKGEFGGMPFEGIGYTGYDNYKKTYVSVWMDNFSTTVMNMTGTCDAAGTTCEFKGDVDDIMTKKKATMRSVTRFVDARTHTFEMYYPGPDGKEFKMMEMVYTRK